MGMVDSDLVTSLLAGGWILIWLLVYAVYAVARIAWDFLRAILFLD